MALEPGSKQNSIPDIAHILPIAILKKAKRESEDTVTPACLFCEGAEAGTASGIELSSATPEGQSRVVHVALKRKHLNDISSLSVINRVLTTVTAENVNPNLKWHRSCYSKFTI